MQPVDIGTDRTPKGLELLARSADDLGIASLGDLVGHQADQQPRAGERRAQQPLRRSGPPSPSAPATSCKSTSSSYACANSTSRLLRRSRRVAWDRVLSDFLVKIGAARVRTMIQGSPLRPSEVEVLKAAMAAYEASFSAGPGDGAERAISIHFVENGLDSEPPGDMLGTAGSSHRSRQASAGSRTDSK